MAVYLSALALVAGLVFSQVSPKSGINSSSPCVGGHLPLAPFSENSSFPYTNYITLYQQTDVDAIVDCKVFNGSIFVDATCEGDVLLPNLTTIYNGGLVAINDNRDGQISGNLTGLIFPILQIISLDMEFFPVPTNRWAVPAEGLTVANITSIRTIWLPALFNYTGNLLISNLPELTNLSTFNSLYGKNDVLGEVCAVNNFEISYTNVSSISIETFCMIDVQFMGNSKLSNVYLQAQNITNLTASAAYITLQNFLDGPLMVDNLDISGCQTYEADDFDTVGGTFSFHNTNVSVASVTLPVYGDLIIVNNAELATVTFTPSLHTGGGGSFPNIGGDFNISKCPSLEGVSLSGAGITSISGSLNVTDNYALSNISMPDLTSIEGSILISNCDAITSISLPNLESIGGDVIIINNTHLSTIKGFTSLQIVSGKVDFQGNFSSVSLPGLDHSFNGFLINSTNSAFNCSEFDQYKSQNFTRGSYTCVGASNIKKTKSVLSIGAKIGIGVGVGIAAITVIAIIVYLRKKKGHSQVVPAEERSKNAELPQGRHFEKAEAPAISRPGELQGEPFPDLPQAIITRKPVPQTGVQQDNGAEQDGERYEM